MREIRRLVEFTVLQNKTNCSSVRVHLTKYTRHCIKCTLHILCGIYCTEMKILSYLWYVRNHLQCLLLCHPRVQIIYQSTTGIRGNGYYQLQLGTGTYKILLVYFKYNIWHCTQFTCNRVHIPQQHNQSIAKLWYYRSFRELKHSSQNYCV